MAEPFLSEIRVFSFGFAPKGWALCNGQLLPINQNQARWMIQRDTNDGIDHLDEPTRNRRKQWQRQSS